jgi:hypothetical protein
MRAVKVLVLVGVLAIGLFATTTTASASHTRYHCTLFAWHPSDNSWTCATSVAGFYRACDYHVDGHRVRGWIDVSGSVDHRITAWAPSQGCTEPAGVAYGGMHIVAIRSCTEAEGCSAWVRW